MTRSHGRLVRVVVTREASLFGFRDDRRGAFDCCPYPPLAGTTNSSQGAVRAIELRVDAAGIVGGTDTVVAALTVAAAILGVALTVGVSWL